MEVKHGDIPAPLDWCGQWEQTKTSYEKLLAAPKLEAAYLFFQDCMKLAICLKASPEFTSKRISALMNSHWEFRLCRDICSGKARFASAPEYQVLHFIHIADSCMNRWEIFLKSALAKKQKQ